MGESLFTLAGEFNDVYEIFKEDPESDVARDTLEGLMGAIESKAEGYVAILNRMDMEYEACKKQKEFWDNKVSVYENGIKRLKDRAAQAMMMMGKDELKAGDYTIKLQGNGGKAPLVLEEDKEVPESYMKVILEPDKQKIREALEAGKKLDFAHIAERGKHIKIK